MLALRDEMAKPYFAGLQEFVAGERKRHEVYPPEPDTYAALRLTPLPAVRAVILGQDPYHGPGQAHGLAFSVRHGTPIPPSLRNIFAELRDDLGVPVPRHGNLEHWAAQGVLLLNRVLTVGVGAPASHRGMGWEKVTEQAIRALVARDAPLVAVLWGRQAQDLQPLLGDVPVVASPHPSPLSASRGFFGSRPFSRVDEHLATLGTAPVDWRLPPVGEPSA